MNTILKVHIGEVKIAKRGETLETILGSCVGIGLIWREKKICGLAHCLLPKSNKRTFDIGARFVDQAVRSLVCLMKIKDADFRDVRAVVAGGGNMTSPETAQTTELVGSANFNAAIKAVKEINFRLVHSDGGGTSGRSMLIDSESFTYQVAAIPKLSNLD